MQEWETYFGARKVIHFLTLPPQSAQHVRQVQIECVSALVRKMPSGNYEIKREREYDGSPSVTITRNYDGSSVQVTCIKDSKSGDVSIKDVMGVTSVGDILP
jgi:hypothetical protein